MSNNVYRNQNQQARPSRLEQFAEAFRLWELAGRSWRTFDREIELEPAFSSFCPPPRIARPIDDARTESLLGRLFSSGRDPGLLADDDEISAGNFAQVQTPLRPAVKTASFRIYLPNELKISSGENERMLLNLAFSASFISFEIIGTGQEIVIQITCPETKKSAVFAQLKSHLPAVDLRESEDIFKENFQLNRTDELVAVDFGLGKAWFVPLPFWKSFATDTFLPLIASFDEIVEGETVCLQILFCRTRGNWQRSVQEAIFDRTGKPVFDNLQNHLAGIKEKLANPLLAASVRLAVQSDSKAKSLLAARRTGAFFRQFSSPSGNELIPLKSEGLALTNHLRSFLDRTTYRTGMLLTAQELAAIVHLPSDAVKSQKLNREENLTKPAPDFATQGNLILGENFHAGKIKGISLSSEKRIKHSHVIGSSGSGKSTLLMQMMKQDLELGNGFACFDPHSDLIDGVLERIPENRTKDVILFDPADEDFPIPFNILSAHSELEKTLLASDLVSIFRRFSTSWGDVMNSILANAVLAFLESNRGGSLLDLKRFLVERTLREEFLKTVADDEIRYYWQNDFPQIRGKPFAPLLTRLDTFLRSKIVRRIVAQKENRLDFRRIMDERKILLVRLSLGAIGEENAYLLGSLLVAKLYQATLSRQDTAEENRSPFFLYLDEAHHFVAESMNQILSGVRKYKLGLVLAHQQLRQFQAGEADILASVLANCYTRICFRLDDADAERLSKGFSFFTAEHLKNLGVGEAICRFEQSQHDFNLKTFPFVKVPKEIAAQKRNNVIEQTRKLYAIPREEVEESFQRRKSEEPKVTPVSVKFEPEFTIVPPSNQSHIDEGNTQHSYLQNIIKRIGENNGFVAILEKPVFGGIGKVDVALENENLKIACEIAVTNTIEYELQNIQKCLAAGFDKIAVISTDSKHLANIRKKVESVISTEQITRVHFLEPDSFHLFLESLSKTQANKENKIKGYKVKVDFKESSESETASRKQTAFEVISNLIKRKGKK